jgi:hypothetical protein
MPTSRRFHRPLALGLAFAALGAPVASAQQDLRNPDNRVPATAAPRQDLRMPDRRAPEPPASPPRTYRDLRSADARDGRWPVVVTRSVPATESGLDFGDAAVGAAVAAALAALAGGATLTVRRRRVVPAH